MTLKDTRSNAIKLLAYKGIAICKKYLDKSDGSAPACSCDHGHAACAHYRDGPCSKELYALIHKGATA